MAVHLGPTPWQAIVITYPTPDNHTHTCQQRWEDIRGDLLEEHLGLTRTHHTLHPIRGVGQAPDGIHSPGFSAYATPINPQAAEDIKTALSIQQAQTQTPHRNTQRGYTIPRPRHPHPPTRAPPSRHQHNRPPPSHSSGSHTGEGPGNLGPTIPGRNQSGAPRKGPRQAPNTEAAPAPNQDGRNRTHPPGQMGDALHHSPHHHLQERRRQDHRHPPPPPHHTGV